MPKGQLVNTGEQTAVAELQRLTSKFAERFDKKLAKLPSSAAAKDLRSNLRSFSGGATKQLKELGKDAASRHPSKQKKASAKPAPTPAKRKG